MMDADNGFLPGPNFRHEASASTIMRLFINEEARS
jgi:hypothetical protein